METNTAQVINALQENKPKPKYLNRTLYYGEDYRRRFDCRSYNECLTKAANAGHNCLSFVCDDCEAYASETDNTNYKKIYKATIDYFRFAKINPIAG